MLKTGQAAPDFAFRNTQGEQVHLHDLLGEKSAVVYFYPQDFTPGCTKEACSFRDMYPTIQGRDVEVVGVSPQGEESHERFRTRYKIPFPLAADTDHAIAKAYGIRSLLGLTKRVTFVIDRQGIIRNVIHSELRIGKHLNGVQTIIDELE